MSGLVKEATTLREEVAKLWEVATKDEANVAV